MTTQAKARERLLRHLERVPPAISAIATVASVIGGLVVGYFDLKATDAELLGRTDRLAKSIERREVDHDLLIEMRGKLAYIQVLLEKTTKADYQQPGASNPYVLR